MNDREIKEQYKNIFDNIHASEDLRNKILLQQKPKKHNFRPIIAAVSSVAAAVAVFAAVNGYDFKTDTSGVISEVVSEETAEPTELPEKVSGLAKTELDKTEKIAVDETKIVAVTEVPANKTVPPIERNRNGDVEEKPTNSTVTSNALIGESKPEQRVEEGETTMQEIETPTIIPEEREVTTGGVQSRSGVLLNINSFSLMPASDVAAAAENYDISDEYITEEWDNNRYFNYIGTDILNDVEYADDLSYKGGGEMYFTLDDNGVPLNDTMIFPFVGNNGRTVSVITSRDLTYANAVISANGIVLSDINGTNAAVFAENGGYSAYMIYNATAYIINTTAITEEEFCTILATLVD